MILKLASVGGDAEGERGWAPLPGRQSGNSDGRHPPPEGWEEDQGPGDLQSHVVSAQSAHSAAEDEKESGEAGHGPQYTEPLLGNHLLNITNNWNGIH